MKLMYDAELQDDMFPTKWSIMTARPSNGKLHSMQLRKAANHRASRPILSGRVRR